MFRWLDLLEKEFDKAFVELDILLGEIDIDQIELTHAGRQKITALSSSFAQLAHKSQTIFQANAKLEAELVALRSGMTEAQAKVTVLESELKNTLLQLHAVQLQLHSSGENTPDSNSIKSKLENELTQFRRDAMKEASLKAEAKQYQKENEEMRNYTVQLLGEVHGARLAAKYLDKELAGRIQQTQLLGRGLKGQDHNILWNQIEAEIHLHRHKTVIRACRGRQDPNKPIPAPEKVQILEDDDMLTVARKKRGIGEPRLVKLHRDKSEGLGVSITGGKEHGVPIIISEIHDDMPAARCKELYVGDAILTVNNTDLQNASHGEAVHVLSRVHGDVTMEVLYVDVDDSGEEDNWEEDDSLRYSSVGIVDDPSDFLTNGEVYMTNSPGDPQRLKNGISNSINSNLPNTSETDNSKITNDLNSMKISTPKQQTYSVPSTPTSAKYPGMTKRVFSAEDVNGKLDS